MACTQQNKLTQAEFVQRAIANPALLAALVNSGSFSGASLGNLLSSTEGDVTAFMPVKIPGDSLATQLDGKPLEQIFALAGSFLKKLEPVLEKKLRQQLEMQFIEDNLKILKLLEAQKFEQCEDLKKQLHDCIRRSVASFCPPKPHDC